MGKAKIAKTLFFNILNKVFGKNSAKIKIKITNALEGDKLVTKLIETSVGRVLFNAVVPHEVGYINELLTNSLIRW